MGDDGGERRVGDGRRRGDDGGGVDRARERDALLGRAADGDDAGGVGERVAARSVAAAAREGKPKRRSQVRSRSRETPVSAANSVAATV